MRPGRPFLQGGTAMLGLGSSQGFSGVFETPEPLEGGLSSRERTRSKWETAELVAPARTSARLIASYTSAINGRHPGFGR